MYVCGKVNIFNGAARENIMAFEQRFEESKETNFGNVCHFKSGVSLPPSRTSRETIKDQMGSEPGDEFASHITL